MSMLFASPARSKEEDGLLPSITPSEIASPSKVALEMRDREDALLQGGDNLGVAKRQWCSTETGHTYLQRAVDAAQRRADRFAADDARCGWVAAAAC